MRDGQTLKNFLGSRIVLVGVRLPRCLEVGSSHTAHASSLGLLYLILCIPLSSSMRPGWSYVSESGGPGQFSQVSGLQCTHNGFETLVFLFLTLALCLLYNSVSFCHSYNPGHPIWQVLCLARPYPAWDPVFQHL